MPGTSPKVLSSTLSEGFLSFAGGDKEKEGGGGGGADGCAAARSSKTFLSSVYSNMGA